MIISTSQLSEAYGDLDLDLIDKAYQEIKIEQTFKAHFKLL